MCGWGDLGNLRHKPRHTWFRTSYIAFIVEIQNLKLGSDLNRILVLPEYLKNVYSHLTSCSPF